jgi:hypothetical protein
VLPGGTFDAALSFAQQPRLPSGQSPRSESGLAVGCSR